MWRFGHVASLSQLWVTQAFSNDQLGFLIAEHISRRPACAVHAGLYQVILAAVCRTVLYNAPLIFLREAETSQGQNDLVLAVNPYLLDFSLNYTAINALASAGGDQVRPHPRRCKLPGLHFQVHRWNGRRLRRRVAICP